MVLPVGGKHSQTMLTVDKINDEEYKTSEHGSFVFVPLLKGKT